MRAETKKIERESWSKSVENERTEMEISWNRMSLIEADLLKVFPKNVNAGYYHDCSLKTLQRVWIEIKSTFDEDGREVKPDPLETSALKMMAQAFTGDEGSKKIRENTGTVYWLYKMDMVDAHGKYELFLFIENAHPMNCKIEKITKEVEVFEITC